MKFFLLLLLVFPTFMQFSNHLILAEYSLSIKPENEQAEHVLRHQNPSTSTIKNTKPACARVHPYGGNILPRFTKIFSNLF